MTDPHADLEQLGMDLHLTLLSKMPLGTRLAWLMTLRRPPVVVPAEVDVLAVGIAAAAQEAKQRIEAGHFEGD